MGSRRNPGDHLQESSVPEISGYLGLVHKGEDVGRADLVRTAPDQSHDPLSTGLDPLAIVAQHHDKYLARFQPVELFS